MTFRTFNPRFDTTFNQQSLFVLSKITRPKDVEIQRSKNFCISTSFGRSKLVTTTKERLPYVQKLRSHNVEILRPQGVHQ